MSRNRIRRLCVLDAARWSHLASLELQARVMAQICDPLRPALLVNTGHVEVKIRDEPYASVADQIFMDSMVLAADLYDQNVQRNDVDACEDHIDKGR